MGGMGSRRKRRISAQDRASNDCSSTGAAASRMISFNELRECVYPSVQHIGAASLMGLGLIILLVPLQGVP